MVRYRYRTDPLVGPWRKSLEEAAQDAVRARQAGLDEHDPSRLRWFVPGRIEADEVERTAMAEPPVFSEQRRA